MVWHVGPYPDIIHTVLESLAYFVGFRWFLRLRRTHDRIEPTQRFMVLGACIFGATLGAKLTVWLDNPGYYWMHPLAAVFGGGKGITGALAGGLLATELVKRWLGVRQSTGDLMVYPLMTGIIIGRIGCFLCGLQDHTYGVPTHLPWAVDFGDGIPRHPTQLYEILFLWVWMGFIYWRSRLHEPDGRLFQWFMVGYFTFRLFIENIKPMPHLYAGLDSVQLLSLFVLSYYALIMLRPWHNASKTGQSGEMHPNGG